jgi:hypothetical protein
MKTIGNFHDRKVDGGLARKKCRREAHSRGSVGAILVIAHLFSRCIQKDEYKIRPYEMA